MDVDVNDVVQTLARKLADAEVQNAVLQAQVTALTKQAEESGNDSEA